MLPGRRLRKPPGGLERLDARLLVEGSLVLVGLNLSQSGLGDPHDLAVARLLLVERDEAIVRPRRIEAGLDDRLVHRDGLVDPAHLLEVLSLEEALDELNVVGGHALHGNTAPRRSRNADCVRELCG